MLLSPRWIRATDGGLEHDLSIAEALATHNRLAVGLVDECSGEGREEAEYARGHAGGLFRT